MKQLLLIVGGLLLVVTPLLRGCLPSPTPETPAIPPPSAALQTAVAPVTAALGGDAADGRSLAGFYAALADVLARDKAGTIATTGMLRELNRRAGTLAFGGTDIVGKHAGLGAAIDKVLADSVGLDNAPLDAAKRAAAVEALQAVAWACQEAG